MDLVRCSGIVEGDGVSGAVEQAISEFIRIALDKYAVITIAGIFILIRAMNAVPIVSQRSVYRRLLPVLPEVLGTLAVFAGSVPMLSDHGIAVKLAFGLWCGYCSQRFHKILGQTILGDDPRIKLKNTSACAYCAAPLQVHDLKCPNCGASTLRALSVPPPPKED